MIAHHNKLLVAMLIGGLAVSVTAHSATVEFVDNGSYVDVFGTTSAAGVASFRRFDIVVTPTHGGLLDPDQGGNGNFDRSASGGNPRVDTWVNTLVSAMNGSDPSILFTEYNPGSPPFTPADQVPIAGATAPNPDQLKWSVFDTTSCDCGVFPSPLHYARILYTPGGRGSIEIQFLDNSNAQTGGEFFSTTYGVPEHSALLLGGLGCASLLCTRRRILAVRPESS